MEEQVGAWGQRARGQSRQRQGRYGDKRRWDHRSPKLAPVPSPSSWGCPSVAWRSPALYHRLTTQPLPQHTESCGYRSSEERLVREVPCLSYPTPQDRSCPSSYSKAASGTVGSPALGIPVLSPVPTPVGVTPGLGDPWSHRQYREVHSPPALLPRVREKMTEPAMGSPYYLLPQQQALCQDSGDPRWSGWHPG